MKAIITVLKNDIGGNADLVKTLTSLSTAVEASGNQLHFHPIPGKNMEFICMLLDENIPYRLTIENSLQEIQSPKERKKKARD